MYKRIIILFFAVMALGSKCTEVDVTDPKVADTMTELNDTWRVGYKEMLDGIGTRHFNVERSQAFNGMKKALENLGFEVVLTEGDYYISISMPAAKMFTDLEWEQVRQNDEPQMKKIATKHLGIKGSFAKLEPEGLMIDGKLVLLEKNDGTDISLSFRLSEITPQPPESILPRREYPPPYAARVGYGKIWRRFEELTMPMTRLMQGN